MTNTVSLHIPKSTFETLLTIATKQGKSVTDIVELAISEYEKKHTEKEYLNISDFARYIGTSKSTAFSYIEKGLVKDVKVKKYPSQRTVYAIPRSEAERLKSEYNALSGSAGGDHTKVLSESHG